MVYVKIRVPVPYLQLIEDFNYSRLFEIYKLEHPKISEKRCARAFCEKYDLIKFYEWKILDHFNHKYDLKEFAR